MKDSSGQKLAAVYYEEEPGPAISYQAPHPRRGAADCSQYREASGAINANDLNNVGDAQTAKPPKNGVRPSVTSFRDQSSFET
jgi:hypothetical protein